MQDFERQDSVNRITWIEAAFAAQSGSAPSAYENYKRAKAEWQDEQSRRQRFYDFLMQRRDLVDAVAKSVIDSSTKEITAKAELIAISENGKMYTFKVEAYDNKGLIGEGTHERFIVDMEKFTNKCNAKKK